MMSHRFFLGGVFLVSIKSAQQTTTDRQLDNNGNGSSHFNSNRGNG
jgi:hypothetical protein